MSLSTKVIRMQVKLVGRAVGLYGGSVKVVAKLCAALFK